MLVQIFPASIACKLTPEQNARETLDRTFRALRALQMVFGVFALLASMTSSRWLHMATNRSKNNFPPPSPYAPPPHFSISACMVPLRLKVLRHRMMSAR